MAEQHDAKGNGHKAVEMELPSSFDAPESSTIASAHYFSDQRVMVVEFKRKPKDKTAERYTFGGVPPELWAEFLTSDSKGRFFTTRIRPNFAGVAQV